MDDPFELQRFVEAQSTTFEQARGELLAGRKVTHWMWFVFPQLEGLGRSEMARRYAISSLDEARAYLEHPILGPRLVECAQIVNGLDGKSAREVFGAPDDLKFRSSLTLFACVARDEPVFKQALEKYFDSVSDPMTLERLGRKPEDSSCRSHPGSS
jgi:uncharacterized protein (DUF1810 family)